MKRDRDIRGEKKREREREEGQKEEADMRRMREREACTRTRLVCGGNISTEINQGCTQISKRKITKINRPDVQCDKKALPSSFSPFSLFSLSLFLCFFALSFSRYPLLVPLSSSSSSSPRSPRRLVRPWTRNGRLHDRTLVGFISITPIVPIKFR